MSARQLQKGNETAQTSLHVAPSPHFASSSMNTQSMMVDVVVALVPMILTSIYVFHWLAITQLIICIASCLLAETLFQKMRNRPVSLDDFSALVTGIILALSLPGTAPWYVGVIASFIAIGVGKAVFGGLGMNIFNPAMVGRAFVMIAFAGALAASGYEDAVSSVDAITQATPMDAFKQTGNVTSLA
ncbi:MAG: RnfABCDGE type electron transport complex subunit D, partial [Desulfobacteraceae bacterium]